MAFSNEISSNTALAPPTLQQKLGSVLPKGFAFNVYHLSTPPTRSPALYSAPPNYQPDRTYCTSHFFTISIHIAGAGEVIVFAIEILIYSTAHDTTFFVSKADSTGYLHLLNLPKTTPSLLREISATFLKHIVEQYQRENIRSIVSLFARAQDQYLFPGSVEYRGKHVLDDRGLIKWWCKVLDPLMTTIPTVTALEKSRWKSVKGYLIIPGLETNDTKAYAPTKSRVYDSSWIIGYPLHYVTRHSEDVPPRCLIPRFPDDPKARLLDELDSELSKGLDNATGRWKSVSSIDQFWELMAFRQECSAGRLVGFIWIIFEPTSQYQPTESIMQDNQNTATRIDSPIESTDKLAFNGSTPATSSTVSSQLNYSLTPTKPNVTIQSSPQSTTSSSPSKESLGKPSGPTLPRQPRLETEMKTHLTSLPDSTPYYIWRPAGRGQVIVAESDYDRITGLIIRLDFSNLELASSSSKRWIDEVKAVPCVDDAKQWGQVVTGTREVGVNTVNMEKPVDGVNTLSMGLVRKRKDAPEENSLPQVNVLTGGMIRKKAKITPVEKQVNALSGGIVRKNSKVAS